MSAAQQDLPAAGLADRCLALFGRRGEGSEQGRLLSSLAEILASLAGRRDFNDAYPRFGPLFRFFLQGVDAGDPERAEEHLTMAYAYLHGADSSYTAAERTELDAAGGYWCHAGGLAPLLLARRWIGPGTRLADYGAGNGLQGLLLQRLYPHRSTTLVELSGRMIARGRRLRSMMGVDQGRVEWVHGSVEGVAPDRFDFIYIYRPLRPEGEAGRAFYSSFARTLEAVRHEVVIFSVADCLRDFLGPSFAPFHDDGQLTCFRNRPPLSAPSAPPAAGAGRN